MAHTTAWASRRHRIFWYSSQEDVLKTSKVYLRAEAKTSRSKEKKIVGLNQDPKKYGNYYDFFTDYVGMMITTVKDF